MSYQLKTKSGATEAVIDDNCGISKFYAIAHLLSEDLQVISPPSLEVMCLIA